jgi:GAG-pre-integrase domain
VEAKPKSIRLWHRRLGHLGLKNVRKLENLVRGMKISENQKDDHDFVCGHCQKARHPRYPFKSHGIRSSAPFEIVYSDICGPFPVSDRMMDANISSRLPTISRVSPGHFV